MNPARHIPQANPGAFVQAHRAEIDAAIARVLDSGRYILGSEVDAFEHEFSSALGSGYAVAVASGTEALWLALKALGLQPGDGVVLPALTASATGAAVVEAGGRPVFADVRPIDLTLDPADVRRRLTPECRFLLPVHLYGNPVAMDELKAIADENGLHTLEDCAQAHGAQYAGHSVGTLGHAGAFSFYPTKNLGALGDGGLVSVPSKALAERVRELREYGWRERYVSASHGWNSRLDEVQAAVLRVALHTLPERNRRRAELAALYDSLLPPTIRAPHLQPPGVGVWHVYPIRHTHRDALRTHLEARGVGTAVHYPVPLHLQPAYAAYGAGPGSLPVTERACAELLSLPMYPELTDEELDYVVEAIGQFNRQAFK